MEKNGKFFSELRYRYLERHYPQIMSEAKKPKEMGSYPNTINPSSSLFRVLVFILTYSERDRETKWRE